METGISSAAIDIEWLSGRFISLTTIDGLPAVDPENHVPGMIQSLGGSSAGTLRMMAISSIGKKIVMAVTGQGMIIFIIVHMLGNAAIYFGDLNGYAVKLHSLTLLLWTIRIVMLTLFVLHVFFGIVLTLENRKAKPDGYAVKTYLKASFASRTMIWTGSVIGAFILLHLLHFTFQIIDPMHAAGQNADALGRPDVTGMVLSAFRSFVLSLIYVVAIGSLFLHLTHGIQSSFQTLGLNNEQTLPSVTKAGTVAAIVLFIGYIAIPLTIVLGIMKG